jgi:hypothetical protein
LWHGSQYDGAASRSRVLCGGPLSQKLCADLLRRDPTDALLYAHLPTGPADPLPYAHSPLGHLKRTGALPGTSIAIVRFGTRRPPCSRVTRRFGPLGPMRAKQGKGKRKGASFMYKVGSRVLALIAARK